MHASEANTLLNVHSKFPLAAAPQITPHIQGIQVIGFINCIRSFHILEVSDAPLIPNSCFGSFTLIFNLSQFLLGKTSFAHHSEILR